MGAICKCGIVIKNIKILQMDWWCFSRTDGILPLSPPFTFLLFVRLLVFIPLAVFVCLLMFVPPFGVYLPYCGEEQPLVCGDKHTIIGDGHRNVGGDEHRKVRDLT